MKLGEFVKEYRSKHNLSQRELALKCGVSNGIISMIEKGINPNTKEPIIPTLPTLKKLANGMQIMLEELLEKIENINVMLDYWDETINTEELSEEDKKLEIIFDFLNKILGFTVSPKATKWHWEEDNTIPPGGYQVEDEFAVTITKNDLSATFSTQEFDDLIQSIEDIVDLKMLQKNRKNDV